MRSSFHFIILTNISV
uniref:Uncharacterized protein n=1 Tax=Anguilla anguilla TaxID=7936 RepID=A0A0E9QPM3_ANGAN